MEVYYFSSSFMHGSLDDPTKLWPNDESFEEALGVIKPLESNNESDVIRRSTRKMGDKIYVPVDIALMICNEIDSRRFHAVDDLRNCVLKADAFFQLRSVSRAFHLAASPFCYRDIAVCLAPTHRFPTLDVIERLSLSPWASEVRTVRLLCEIDKTAFEGGDGSFIVSSFWPYERDVLPRLLASLERLTALQTLEIHGPSAQESNRVRPDDLYRYGARAFEDIYQFWMSLLTSKQLPSSLTELRFNVEANAAWAPFRAMTLGFMFFHDGSEFSSSFSRLRSLSFRCPAPGSGWLGKLFSRTMFRTQRLEVLDFAGEETSSQNRRHWCALKRDTICYLYLRKLHLANLTVQGADLLKLLENSKDIIEVFVLDRVCLDSGTWRPILDALCEFNGLRIIGTHDIGYLEDSEVAERFMVQPEIPVYSPHWFYGAPSNRLLSNLQDDKDAMRRLTERKPGPMSVSDMDFIWKARASKRWSSSRTSRWNSVY